MSSLKDELFNEHTVSLLGKQIKEVHPDFDLDGFVRTSVIEFINKELKERMTVVTEQLNTYLPFDYPNNLFLLEEALEDSETGHFVYGSVLEYIERYGCTDEYVALSLEYIGRFTRLLSGEFAIRSFLNQYPKDSLQKVLEWSTSDDVHRRRLASEGVRPKLPWSKNITVDYQDASLSLHNLYYDEERYVTRSVANHLNDISKMDPNFVLDTLQTWKEEGLQNEEEMTYIIKHSLRTLIKKGHTETLEFLGYKSQPKIQVHNLTLNKDTISVGDVLEFAFDIESNDNTKLICDYIITYQTKLSKPTHKIYKHKVLEISKNNQYHISGKRSFKPISTRNFYPGTHKISIQINGNILLEKEFTLQT